jgi:hypothetical protein
MTFGRGGKQGLQQAPGTIYVPLSVDDSGDLPVSWTQGSVCMQTTSAVGSDGAAITQQVDSADCQPGFDSACPSTCAASVGTTFTTIDPVVLIGG